MNELDQMESTGENRNSTGSMMIDPMNKKFLRDWRWKINQMRQKEWIKSFWEIVLKRWKLGGKDWIKFYFSS